MQGSRVTEVTRQQRAQETTAAGVACTSGRRPHGGCCHPSQVGTLTCCAAPPARRPPGSRSGGTWARPGAVVVGAPLVGHAAWRRRCDHGCGLGLHVGGHPAAAFGESGVAQRRCCHGAAVRHSAGRARLRRPSCSRVSFWIVMTRKRGSPVGHRVTRTASPDASRPRGLVPCITSLRRLTDT